MSGYTDALILEAPVTWWPSMKNLHQHPLDSNRSLAAASAAGAMHLLSDTSSVHLSRLGRSIFRTARWRSTGAALPTEVVLLNPFAGADVTWHISSLTDKSVLRCGQTPAQLADEGRVRLAPASLAQLTQSSSSIVPDEELFSKDVLYERYFTQLWRRCEDFFSAPYASRVGLCSFLISGERGCGKHTFMRLLRDRLRGVLTTAAGSDGRRYHFFVEHRMLNVMEVLALESHEALQVVKAVLQPPPPAMCSASTSVEPTTFVRPLVWVSIEHADLLWSDGNELVDIVSYQLCASLDALKSCSAAFVLYSTASDTTRLSRTLLARLARWRMHITAPPLAERTAWVVQRLEESHVTPADAERVAVQLSGRSIGQLTKLSRAALRAMVTDATTSDVPHQKANAYGHLFGVDHITNALEELLVWPLTHLPLLQSLHIPCMKGAVLCGPSGCGKTALLTALARRLEGERASRVNVLLVDGLTLIEKEVGRSERNIASLFSAARSAAPTALFLDNLEALAPPRGRQSSETTTTTDRTLSALLMEMDGLTGDPSRVVVVVAAVSSMDALDPAVCRPGRLDVHLSVAPPTLASATEAMAQQLSSFATRLVSRTANNQSSTPCDMSAVHACVAQLSAAYLDSKVTHGAVPSAAEVMAATREVMVHVLRGWQDSPCVSSAASSADVTAQLVQAFKAL